MSDQLSPGVAQLAGLSPAQMGTVFPFHIVVDRNLDVVQVGRSLRTLVPGATIGAHLPQILTLRRPSAEWSFEALEASQSLLHIVELPSTGLVLRGQMLRLDTPVPLIAFLCTPWLEGPESLDRLGLKLGDFALHDAAQDLVQTVQSHRIANEDLRRLTQLLTEQRAELRRVNDVLRAQNEALTRTKRDLEEAQSVALLGSWWYDAATGQLDWSEECGRIIGLDSATAERRLSTLESRLYPKDRPLVERLLGSDGELPPRIDVDFRIVRPDGEVRYVHVRGRAEATASGTRLAGTLQDITRRKRSESTLRVQREEIRKLALVASRTDNGVLVTDEEGRIEWANLAFRRLSGYSAAELKGQRPGHLLQCEQTDSATVAMMRSRLQAGEGFTAELLNRARDGRLYWITIDVQPVRGPKGNITNFISVQRDVTRRREQEEQLARLTAERNTILELSPDAFLAFDEHGAYVYSNPAASQLLGLSAEALATMRESTIDTLIAGRAISPQAPIPAGELADGASDVIRLDRPRVTLRRAVRLVRGPDGLASGRVVYLQDITREAELDRMRSEFLATAAHELRTPMSSIHGFSELMLTRDLDAATQREVAETIHNQSGLIVRMVTELLDLERIASGAAGTEIRVRELPFLPVVRRVIDGFLFQDDPRRIEFENGLGDGIIALFDEDKLSQALMNVLSNAFKYSRSRGGPIRVALARRHRRERDEIGLIVRDDGIGMTPEQAAHIFDRFYRADPDSGVSGTGLGMTLVKEIIEAMDGSVDIASRLGHGTTVTLWLCEVLEFARRPATR
jgi:PAS domain S-box-containing protein